TPGNRDVVMAATRSSLTNTALPCASCPVTTRRTPTCGSFERSAKHTILPRSRPGPSETLEVRRDELAAPHPALPGRLVGPRDHRACAAARAPRRGTGGRGRSG